MKAIVVMNGKFYSGENVQENKLNFSPNKSKAVEVDERRLRYITQCVLRWSMDGIVKLKRLEILEVRGGLKDESNLTTPTMGFTDRSQDDRDSQLVDEI